VAEISQPTLCLIDEIDARQGESWPYENLFPYLDLSKQRPIVFVLVGSAGEGKEALVRLIQDRPKGSDLIDRIPARQRIEIPPPLLGDRLLVLVSALLEHGTGDPVQEVEKLALYYALSRVPNDQRQIYYDSLFSAGDRENQQFYADHIPVGRSLQHRFIRIMPEVSVTTEGSDP
jgi:hypothetical protein